MHDCLRGRRQLLLAFLLATGALGSSAQDYPLRPIQMLVPFAAGGGLDLNARNLAEAMAQELAQSMAVVNRDGAAGTIGLTTVANARPDGYALAFTPAVPLSSEPHRLKSLQYGLDSFRYVCQVFDNIFAIAVPGNSPYRSIADILADARKDPGKVNYGTSGTGSIPHLGTSDIEATTKVSLTHVPYKGDAPMLQDLLGNRLSFGAVLVSSITGQLNSGALRLIAVYADKRHPSFASVPTLREAGVPVVQASFGGVLAPARTPDAVIGRLEASCRAAVASPRYQEWARGANQVVDFRPGKEFERNVREDSRLKAETIQRLGLNNP
ncbi:Bug family tripartite tricarboxylate transporter substrate binding protein [Variovorax saccharolyticus]|uniref:Bug family tripartite tricarboxylate transporter substrate binding protein n=1 Tax=Variovorax saccharolyticus TaxID=3053516 RepID=UPI002578BE66|nr:tripartite tricarboxylate transporter substrate binding protein [Variovorax sp. J31P216]MDM0025271.1 tripartite tricarboxylate transporter substrate binding protein [Variovorax sp. J31P216]